MEGRKNYVISVYSQRKINATFFLSAAKVLGELLVSYPGLTQSADWLWETWDED